MPFIGRCELSRFDPLPANPALMRQHPTAGRLLWLLALLLPLPLWGQGAGAPPPSSSPDMVPVSPARIASGTGWQPDATPMHSLDATLGGWRLMAHGSAALSYVRAETRKGGARFGLANWAMARGSRSLPGGTLSLTVMGSAERLTVGECGFPRLLSSVSTCPSNAVRDFQHPHPPLMELAALHQRRIAGPVYLELYGGLAGEPALGPPPYLHRYSAAADPVAPISTHETNPGHASAGVLTGGIYSRNWKVEGSLFNTTPADPDRILPHLGPLKAVAARISLNPSSAWSMQASVGRIPATAGHHVGATGAIRSLIGSAIHHRAIGERGAWATTFILSRMDDGTLGRNSLLLESSFSPGGVHTWFGRLEYADRLDSRVTIIEHPDGTHDHLVDNRRVEVGQVSAGYLLSRAVRGADIGVGVRGALSFLPADLEPTYQTRRPTSFSVYGSLRPGVATAGHHH